MKGLNAPQGDPLGLWPVPKARETAPRKLWLLIVEYDEGSPSIEIWTTRKGAERQGDLYAERYPTVTDITTERIEVCSGEPLPL